MNLSLLMLPNLEMQSWSILLGLCDFPVLYPLLEDSTHHMGPTISYDVFWDVPCGTEVSHNGDQLLAVELARWGGHDGVLSREPVGYHQEVVAME